MSSVEWILIIALLHPEVASAHNVHVSAPQQENVAVEKKKPLKQFHTDLSLCDRSIILHNEVVADDPIRPNEFRRRDYVFAKSNFFSAKS